MITSSARRNSLSLGLRLLVPEASTAPLCMSSDVFKNKDDCTVIVCTDAPLHADNSAITMLSPLNVTSFFKKAAHKYSVFGCCLCARHLRTFTILHCLTDEVALTTCIGRKPDLNVRGHMARCELVAADEF